MSRHTDSPSYHALASRRSAPFEMELYRGEREKQNNKEYAHDPGDFGRGIYYTSNIHQARAYGEVSKVPVRLDNPLRLTAEQAYDLGERDYGNLVQGTSEERMEKAVAMTSDLLAKGYDGLVVEHRDWLEVVVYHPCSEK